MIDKFKNNDDQILIQNFISNPEISGVLFTKDKTTNSRGLAECVFHRVYSIKEAINILFFFKNITN